MNIKQSKKEIKLREKIFELLDTEFSDKHVATELTYRLPIKIPGDIELCYEIAKRRGGVMEILIQNGAIDKRVGENPDFYMDNIQYFEISEEDLPRKLRCNQKFMMEYAEAKRKKHAPIELSKKLWDEALRTVLTDAIEAGISLDQFMEVYRNDRPLRKILRDSEFMKKLDDLENEVSKRREVEEGLNRYTKTKAEVAALQEAKQNLNRGRNRKQNSNDNPQL